MKKITARLPLVEEESFDLFMRSLVDNLNEAQDSIASLDQALTTVSASYSQSEVQAIANNVKVLSDKVDAILVLLRDSNLISS